MMFTGSSSSYFISSSSFLFSDVAALKLGAHLYGTSRVRLSSFWDASSLLLSSPAQVSQGLLILFSTRLKPRDKEMDVRKFIDFAVRNVSDTFISVKKKYFGIGNEM